VNFTALSRVLHRHRPRSSPVNFTEFPRVLVLINTMEDKTEALFREVEQQEAGGPPRALCGPRRPQFTTEQLAETPF
jgi:hypothetical protein